jgi:hypothetical protein
MSPGSLLILGGERRLLLVLVLLYWLTMVGSLGAWVTRDARARGSDQPVSWALASVFTPIGLPYYLYRRYRRAGFGERESPPTRDRILATWASATLGAFLAGAIFSPPDPLSQIRYTLGGFLVLLPSSYLLVYRGGYRRIRDWLGF